MGTDFPSLEAAYLDAYRAASEMWLQMARQGRDCSDYRFEITNLCGDLLMELPFREVLRPQPGSPCEAPTGAVAPAPPPAAHGVAQTLGAISRIVSLRMRRLRRSRAWSSEQGVTR